MTGDRKKEGIFPNLSIFENMLLPVYNEYRAGGVINIINTTKLDPIFNWESEKLEIKMGARGDPITSLSGGNQQKVLIARAFAEKPNVLVLNDPTRGVDIGAKLDLYHNLREFASGGKSVVFLSSEIEEFLNLCNRVVVFRNGTITREFQEPFDANVILNATFGKGAGFPAPPGHRAAGEEHDEPREAPSAPANRAAGERDELIAANPNPRNSAPIRTLDDEGYRWGLASFGAYAVSAAALTVATWLLIADPHSPGDDYYLDTYYEEQGSVLRW